MIRGIYTAATGMRLQFDRIDIYANNLANSQTNGYKRNEVVAQAFPELLIQMAGSSSQPGRLGIGVRQVDTVQDMRAGILQFTGNVMHIAIEGEGFLVVRKDIPAAPGRPASSTMQQTRNGALSIDSQRRLTTADGSLLMDINNQPITLSQETTNHLDESLILRKDGSVVERVGGVDRVAGKLRLAMVRHMAGVNPLLGGRDSSLQLTTDQDKQPKIVHRFLEESNLFIVNEMVNLTSAAKTYDTAQKAITTQDKMLDKVINEVGRPQS